VRTGGASRHRWLIADTVRANAGYENERVDRRYLKQCRFFIGPWRVGGRAGVPAAGCGVCGRAYGQIRGPRPVVGLVRRSARWPAVDTGRATQRDMATAQ